MSKPAGGFLNSLHEFEVELTRQIGVAVQDPMVRVALSLMIYTRLAEVRRQHNLELDGVGFGMPCARHENIAGYVTSIRKAEGQESRCYGCFLEMWTAMSHSNEERRLRARKAAEEVPDAPAS